MLVDVTGGRLVEPNGSPYSRGYRWVRGDDILLHIDLVTVNQSTSALTAFAVNPATVYALETKQEKSYDGPSLILSEPDLWNLPGDRADLNVAGGKLSCRIKLNRRALLNALGSSNASLRVITDIEAISPDGSISTLVQWSDAILNDARRNPDLIDENQAQYMTLQDLQAMVREVTHPTGGFYQVEEGEMMLWDLATETYRRVALNDGAFAVLEDE